MPRCIGRLARPVAGENQSYSRYPLVDAVPSRIRNPVAGSRCEDCRGPRDASSVSSRIPLVFSRDRGS